MKISYIRNNIFDKYLILLIAMQIFGIYGGALQPIRVFSIVSFPFLLSISGNLKLLKNNNIDFFYFFIFLLYAVISTIFVQAKLIAFKEITYLLINFITIFNLILVATNALNPKLSLIRGWALFFIISIPFALTEIFFDWHFSNSNLASESIIGGIGALKRFSAFTFGNYNLFNLLLIYSFPFLMAVLLIPGSKIKLNFTWVIIVIMSFIILVNGSRGAFISLLIGLFILIKKYFIHKRSNLFGLILILISTVYFLITKATDYLIVLSIKSENLFEDNIRLKLVLNGLELLKDSFFLGVGAGNLSYKFRTEYGMAINAPHNMFLEILVQYGVFIFLGFIFLLYRIYRSSFNTDQVSRFIITTTLIILPISSLINSGYIVGVNMWVLIGSLMILSNSNYRSLV